MRVTLLVALLLASAVPVSGAILDGAILQQSGQGRFIVLDASQPFAVGQDHFDDDNLYAFDEAQMITLTRALAVDIGGTPEGVLPIGTELASHYVFFDSVQSSHFAYVVFDAPILGVATRQATLAASDDLAGTRCAMSARSCAVWRQATRFGSTLRIPIACSCSGPDHRRGITSASLPQRPATRP
jgi:hypothetical protein